MRQVLYLFISGFLAFLSCTQDKIQMVSLGIDDVYYLPRMKTYLLSPAFTGDEYRWTLHRNGTDSLVSTERSYIFLAKDTGTYQMTFEIIDKETPYKHDFRFEVMQEEIEYSPYLSKVYDFCPAPGQFVNTMPEYEEGDTKETILKKVEENISGTNYATCLYADLEVQITDTFGPFLYPNQYVNFNADSKVVTKGQELADGASSDLEVITRVYDYITQNITYDHVKASDPPTGYTSDVDAILTSGTGICLDYAAVMASMLRSQRIPTRLEVGYAQDAYHAWISIYTADTGWLNGIIEFDGNVWTLVDPTFGANTDDKALKKFIGDGTNYILQKMY